MAEATNQERKNQAELNQSRTEIREQSDESSEDTSSSPAFNPVETLLILGAAVTVDIIDILDLTGFGAILVRFIDVPTLLALWLWRVSKHQVGPQKNPTFQILLAFLVELSPFGIIPAWSIFVLYVYFQDTKLGKETIGKAEKLISAKK